ncbi:MAG TPA: nuclease-related domain-containing protein [Nitrososphaeraceae archaeon]
MSQNQINPVLLARGISGIPESKSVSEFQERCGIASRRIALELLDFLSSRNIGKISGNRIEFDHKDKLRLALVALCRGCRPEILSSKIDWKDFELFTLLMLQKNAYRCEHNVSFTRPRIQIDLVAKYGRTCLIIDCKHWHGMSPSIMNRCANGQLRRAKVYLEKTKASFRLFPIIVTLNEMAPKAINGVPFVPISKLDGFLQDCQYFYPEVSG